MKSLFWLSLYLCFSFSFGYSFLEEEEDPNQIFWPSEYKLTGEKIRFTSGIKTPFTIWYSSEYNKSRIDYYDGMVKMYYYGETEDTFGQIYQIHPVSNEEVENEMTCTEVENDGEQKDFLPDISEFEYQADEDMNGVAAQKWVNIYADEETSTRIEKNLWVSLSGKNQQALPVRYEVKTYNTWLGSLETYIIENYFDFDPNFDSDELDAEGNVECDYKHVLKGDPSSLDFVDIDLDEHVDKVFDQFKEKHGRKYADKLEHQIRRNIFRRNLEKVITRNQQNLGYKLELNRFADRTEEELRHLTALKPSDPNSLGTIPFPYDEERIKEVISDIPDEFDLRLEGVITPVKDQAHCGSCWAFTLAATLEGAIARSNGGRALRLSEQAFVDCAWGFTCSGCEGGTLDGAFKFALKHGIPTEEQYGPYLEMDGYCHIENATGKYPITGFTKVTPLSEDALKIAIYNHGPVAVSIHASDEMKLYSSGVFYDIYCDEPDTYANHGVTVVGYGKRDGQTYWIVKNSWGDEFGEEGYILMSAKNNNCLVESNPYYAVV